MVVVSEIMISFVKYSFVAVGLSIPVEYKLSIEKLNTNQIELVEYKSPTLNYNPFKEYEDKKMNELIEKIFIEE